MKNIKQKILLIEDDMIDKMAFERFAKRKKFPYDYDIVDSIKDARQKLDNCNFDAVVTDFHLSDGNAIDLFSDLKEIPFIVVTGAGDQEIAVQAMKSGAYDYMIKDAEGKHLQTLQVTIENAINRKKANDELQRYREQLEELVQSRTIDLQKEIDERKRAEQALRESEVLFRTVVSASKDAMISIDKNRHIMIFNPAAEQMFDKLKADMIGKSLDNLMTPEFGDKYGKYITNFFQTGVTNSVLGNTLEIPAIKSNGTIFPVDIKLSEGYRGKEPFILAIIRDASERKKNEYELMAAKEKAEESDRLKTSFLANISHEIRTPLNGVVGFASLLNRDINVQTRVKYVNIINKSAEQLVHIIDDIVDISKIEANQLDVLHEETDINSLMNDLHLIFETNKANNKKEHISLSMHKGLADNQSIIISDAPRIRQILTNLIGNAFKYSEKGSIKFGYKVVDTKEKKVQLGCKTPFILEFFVEDNGIGIENENINIIFKRFRQGEETLTRSFGGTGLGLSISKGLVELLGGKIWVESEIEKGSVFYFSIPFHPVKEIAIETYTVKRMPVNEYDWSGKNVLVVEDEDMNYQFIETLLMTTNAKLTRAINGQEAVEIAKSMSEIDIILMDIQLPIQNGYEATRQIRLSGIKAPIIAQTAYAMSDDRKKAIDAGCNDYISKPINRKILFNKMNKFLK